MDLVIHIGLQKTGTTTLQNHLFPDVPGYLGKSQRGGQLLDAKSIREFKKAAVGCRLNAGRQTQEKAQNFVEKLLNKKRLNSNLDRMILSDEGLCRWPIGPHYQTDDFFVGDMAKQKNRRSRPLPFAAFLRDYFKPAWDPYGNIQVVITLRSQAAYLASLYAQISLWRRNASQKDFENQVSNLFDGNDPAMDWDGIVEDISRVVGKDQTSVLLFEDMGEPSFWRQAARAFRMHDIPDHLLAAPRTVKENVHSKEKQVWQIKPRKGVRPFPSAMIRDVWPRERQRGQRLVLGGARRLLDPVLDPVLGRLVYAMREGNRGREISVSSELDAFIKDNCAAGNQRLAQRLNRDLARLGY